MNEYLNKKELLDLLSDKKNKWSELKGRDHDVTHENFIDNVLFTLGWIIRDIERM